MRLKRRDRRAERRAEAVDLAARFSTEMAAALRGVTVRHDVKHLIEHAPRPRPTEVYAEITNGSGELWRVAPWTLAGQAYADLSGIPIAFITGRAQDAALGQARIRLRFEY